eukprot:jgi/Mesvir1/3206/Mv16357-RA.1
MAKSRFMRSPREYFLLLGLAYLAAINVAQFAGASMVVELDQVSFPKIVAKHKKPIYVEFYAPDCGHCQQMERVLEEVAEELTGLVTVVKVDARSSHNINREYGVRQTPTLLLFKNGSIVEESREDLHGLRAAPYIVQYLRRYVGSSVAKVSTREELDELAQEHGVAVVGLFDDSEGSRDKYKVFREVADKQRRLAKFAAVTDSSATISVAEFHELDTLPTAFVLKRHNVVVPFQGPWEGAALDAWVKDQAFPLVGNFSVLTYFRYMKRELPMMHLFYDQNDEEGLTAALEEVERAAVELEGNFSVVTVEKKASEEDARLLLRNTGLSFFRMPAVSIRTVDKKHSYAFNQLIDIKADRIVEFAKSFRDKKGIEASAKCLVSNNKQRAADYTPEELARYEEFAISEKERFSFMDDEVREVDESAFRGTIAKTQKDVLILYTARWCAHSLHLEDTLHKLVRAGEFKDLIDAGELMLLKVDVVLTAPPDNSHIATVPQIKYISARYKEFPNWFAALGYDPESVVRFVRSYHSMRFVEIPGDGPSPFTVKKQKEAEMQALLSASQDMI